MNLVALCALLLFHFNVNCERSAKAVRNLLQLYSHNINNTLYLSKNDRELLDSWAEEFQVKQVNVTTRYRLQMVRHKEHNFRRINDKKWVGCIDVHSIDINRSQRTYIETESGCIKAAVLESKDKRQAVDQVEREIKKWRKSYKYLSHLCDINYPNDEKGAGACLVDYIEQDDYNSTLQRLIILKIEAMAELYLRLTESITNLEECLKTNLSSYLSMVRRTMEDLHKCYNGNIEE